MQLLVQPLKSWFFVVVMSVSLSSYSVQSAEPQLGVQDSIKADLVNPGYHEKPSWFKESFLDLREDVQEASDNKKRVLIYFYQDGCPYCAKLLQDNLGQKKLADKTRKHFDVIAINMWGDKEVTDLQGNVTTEKKWSEQMKVMYTPTLLFLTEKGKVALRVNGYYAPNKFETALDYVRNHYETKVSFRNYVRKNLKTATSGKLNKQDFILNPPYSLKKLLSSNKPLLVLFEQKNVMTVMSYIMTYLNVKKQ